MSLNVCGVLLLAVAGVAAAQEPAPVGQVVQSEPKVTVPKEVPPATPVTDAERAAVEVSSLALDLHLTPAEAREEVHATVVVRNVSGAALARFPLQLSSTLHWLSASGVGAGGLKPVAFTQSPIATDADHTGYAEEAVFTPAEPLGAGAALTLSVIYAGEIKQAGDRLELIGAPHDKAIATDWDAIQPTSDAGATALRGFGNVLWYPVAAPVARLGNGNQLFEAIARERRRNTGVSIRMRLTVEYVGDPPDSAIFNGQLKPLERVPDEDVQVIEETHGTATVEFASAPVGFRTPSLFLTAQHAVTTADQALSIVSPQADVADPYVAAATSLGTLLAGFLGPVPRSPLLLLDHDAEPFEDGGFLAAKLSPTAEAAAVAPAIARGLAHAWLSPQGRAVPATSLWVEEGLPEFMSEAWMERSQGREAAIGALRHASVLVALAEGGAAGPAQPLTEASSDVYLRLKAAFVFWQLRELLGDTAFSEALTAFRHSLALNPAFDADARAFERSVEKTSGKDLGWFFEDWVYHDKGLPDLAIVQANPRALPVGKAGSPVGGSLVAVEVRNDGDAVADVPVTVRAGTLAASERLRIPAHGSATTRIVFGGVPEIVEVNDGSVPEVRGTTHTFALPGTAAQP